MGQLSLAHLCLLWFILHQNEWVCCYPNIDGVYQSLQLGFPIKNPLEKPPPPPTLKNILWKISGVIWSLNLLTFVSLVRLCLCGPQWRCSGNHVVLGMKPGPPACKLWAPVLWSLSQFPSSEVLLYLVMGEGVFFGSQSSAQDLLFLLKDQSWWYSGDHMQCQGWNQVLQCI